MFRHAIIGGIALILALGVLVHPAAADWEVGQAVEVRRGEQWMPAKITRKINGNYQIRYDAGGLVVVGPSRVRASAQAGADTGNATSAGGTQEAEEHDAPEQDAAPSRPQAPAWRPRQKVEVKSGASWDAATIIRRQGDWWLVQHERLDMGEWVEPWRIREAGSDEDSLGIVMPNRKFRQGRRAPTAPSEPPGEPPLPFEARMEAHRAAREAQARSRQHSPDPVPTAPVAAAQRDAIRDLWADAPFFTQPRDAEAIPIDIPSGDAPSRGTVTVPGANSLRATIVVARGAPIAVMASRVFRGMVLHRLDLTQRALLDSAQMGDDLILADISADGRRALLLPDTFHDDKRLQVWELGENPAEVARLAVALDHLGEPDAPKWCAMAPGGRIVTLDEHGRLGLWDLESPKVTHQFRFDRGTEPCLSPGGRLLAGVANTEIVILDLQEGTVSGRVPTDSKLRLLRFAPDSRHLFGSSFGELHAWDLTTGELVGSGRGMSAFTGYAPLDAEHVLTGAEDVVNLRGMVILRYTSAGTMAVGPRGLLFHATRPFGLKETRLAWVDQPHAEAVRKASTWNPRDHVLIPAGATVAVSMEGNFEVGTTAEAAAGLKAALTQAGYKVAPASNIHFKGSAQKGKTITGKYRERGSIRAETHELTITPTHYQIVAEVDGKVVWQHRTIADVPSLEEKEEVTLQAQVEEMTRARAGIFKHLPIPREIIAPYPPMTQDLPE